MADYRYVGPGPEEHDGEAVHPGDVREFGQDPGWGLWERLEGEPAAPEPAPAALPEAPAEGTEGGF